MAKDFNSMTKKQLSAFLNEAVKSATTTKQVKTAVKKTVKVAVKSELSGTDLKRKLAGIAFSKALKASKGQPGAMRNAMRAYKAVITA